MTSEYNILLPIVKELISEPYLGKAFSLKGLSYFIPSKKITETCEKANSEYYYSVNSVMYFALCIMDYQLKLINGKTSLSKAGIFHIQIDAAARTTEEQAELVAELAELRKNDNSIMANRVLDLSEKVSPSCTGSAIHGVLGGRTHVRDLLKEGGKPNGKWLSEEEQAHIKTTYFEKFNDLSWPPKMTHSMQMTNHISPTKEGKSHPMMGEALANNHILLALYSCIPLLTPTNDFFYIAQLRPYFDEYKFNFPILTLDSYKKQDAKETEFLANEIRNMAERVWKKEIYYWSHIEPGRRFEMWGPNAKGNDTKMGTDEFMHNLINQALKDGYGYISK